MKIVIIGDNHFGASYAFGKPDPESGLNSRLVDYEKTLSNIVDYVIAKKIELCIFLGDIFETRNPTPQQVVVFYKQIKRLSNNGVIIYVIPGNHDQLRSRKTTSSLDPLRELNVPNVFIFSNIELVTFTDSTNESINVLLVPYRNRQSYDKQNNEDAINEIWTEINLELKKSKKNVPTLACLHMMLEDTIPSDAGDYALNELVLPFEMFDGIDVTVAGHIHRSSILKESPLFIYSGSMDCKDFSEKDHEKCFLVYDSQKSGLNSISFKGNKTRKFIDFEIDYSVDLPDNPMKEILTQIEREVIVDAVVRLNVKVAETKTTAIDLLAIREKFIELKANCISDITVTPVISKQLRNQKVKDAPDDVSAFKHYISAQTNVGNDVLAMGLAIITADLGE